MTTFTELTNEVDSIFTEFTNSRDKMQQWLIKAAIFVAEHGDIRPIVHAANKAPDGINKKALGDWINDCTLCNLEYDSKSGEYTGTFRRDLREKATDMLDKGKTKPWYKYAPQKVVKPWDLVEEAERLLTTAKNKAKERQKLLDSGDPVKIEAARDIRIEQDALERIRQAVYAGERIAASEEQANQSEVA